MLDIAVVATWTRACGCYFGVSTITSAVFGTDETDTLAVGAGSSAALGSSAVLVDSVTSDCTVRAVAVPVFRVDSTASWLDLVDCCEALGFFFFFGVGSAAAGFVSPESVDVSAFSSAGCSDGDDVPEVDEPLKVDDESEPEVLDGSADATPCPTKTAAPIREPPPIHRSAGRTPQLSSLCTYRRSARPSAAWPNRLPCVAWVNFDGDQPRQRHAGPIGTVEAPPRRGPDPEVRLDGVAGADVRRRAGRPQVQPSRR